MARNIPLQPPAEPLPPEDPRVNLMDEGAGPFRCDNCFYYNGSGTGCRWTYAALKDGKCCNQFWPKAWGDPFEVKAAIAQNRRSETEFWKSVSVVCDEALAKAHRIRIDPSVIHPKAKAALHALQFKVHHMFIRQKRTVIEYVRKHYKVKKGKSRRALQKKTPQEMWNEIFDSLLSEFNDLPDETEGDLEAAALDGVQAGLAQLGVDDQDVISAVNESARAWAESRAAEMVGMRRNENGDLEPNPSAEWAITDTTRDEIRRLITNAFSEEMNLEDLVSSIQDAGGFSEERASLIASTEISAAQTGGNYSVWEVAGVPKVMWLMSDDHEVSDECDDNDEEVVELGEPFPSGDMMPPAHPACMCAIVAVYDDETESESESE